MKKEILNSLIKRMDNMFDSDIGAPIRQQQNLHSDKVLKFLEYRFNISLKNIDVVIDLLKVLLSVSGSILIAKYTVVSLSIKSSYIEFIFISLIISLFILLITRTRMSNNAIDKYNIFLDLDSKSIRDYSNVYFKELRRKLELMKEEVEKLFKEQKKK